MIFSVSCIELLWLVMVVLGGIGSLLVGFEIAVNLLRVWVVLFSIVLLV